MTETVLEGVWTLVMLVGFAFSLRRYTRAQGDLRSLTFGNGSPLRRRVRMIIALGWIEGARYLMALFLCGTVAGLLALVNPNPATGSVRELVRVLLIAAGLVMGLYVVRGDQIRGLVNEILEEEEER